jgi:hypothetical protein
VLLTGSWTLLANTAPGNLGTMMLLPDGTVMAQQAGTSNNWYSLAPQAFTGSYINGSWSARAPMSLQRLYYASNVLPNGKVFLVGGEYSGPQGLKNLTNKADMYDPVTNTWADANSATAIPDFLHSQFGDDPSAMLPDGRVLTGYFNSAQTYIFDPATNSWSYATNKLRNDNSDEETWVKLPHNSILSYDVCVNDPAGCSRRHAQRYVPSSNTWVDAGNAPNNLTSSAIGYELGPAFRLPDSRVFQLGANSNTAFYYPSLNTWAAGPTIPGGLGADDAPGAMLPNGNVLFAADTPKFNGPTHIFEFNPNTNAYTDVTPAGFDLSNDSVDGGNPGASYHTRMLVLPTGQVLLSIESNQLDVFTPNEAPNNAWRPTITSISRSGGTVTLTGTQLNGISEGAVYGDDAEMSSNYPLVQLLGAPFIGNAYVRTSNWSSTGVAEGSTPESVQFQLGTGTDLRLQVVANGIASPTALAIEMSPSVNSILLRVDPSNAANLQILNNGSFFDSVPFSSFSSILVTGDSSADTLTVDYSNGNPIPGGGLNYQGGGGVDTLTVNDANRAFSDFSPHIYTVTATTVQAPLSGPITYSAIAALTLDTGFSAFGLPVETDVTGTRAGTNTAVSTRGSVNFVNVGSGTLAAIQGPLAIGGPGIAALTVNDANRAYNDIFSHTYTVTATTVQAPESALITYGATAALTLDTGLGLGGPPVETDVTGTGAGTNTTVTTNGSLNFVTVGNAGSLGGIQAP